MKTAIKFFKISFICVIIYILSSCTKEGYAPNANSLLKKVVSDGYVVDQYTYNNNNLITEVNGTMFYRKFTYDENNRLYKEEVAISPNSFSSLAPTGDTHAFVDPSKTGITLYSIYKYQNGNLSRQLNYVNKNGQFEYGSMRTFEYNDNNQAVKVLLHTTDSTVTQYFAYKFDNNGNVTQEDYFTYLFIPAGTGPKLLQTTTYEYDSYYNPFIIFKQSNGPGIFTNKNNIIKTTTHNFDPSPGTNEYSESTYSYEYNSLTGFPVKVKNGEEYIYD
jgi:hypothetical protein